MLKSYVTVAIINALVVSMQPNVSTRIECFMQKDAANSVTYTSIREPIVASLVEGDGKLTKYNSKKFLNMRSDFLAEFLEYPSEP